MKGKKYLNQGTAQVKSIASGNEKRKDPYKLSDTCMSS